MLSFNLLLPEKRVQAVQYKQFILLFRVSLQVIFWLLLLTFLVLFAHVMLRRELSLMKESTDRLVTYNNHVAKSGLSQNVKQFEDQIKILQKIRPQDMRWSPALAAVFSILPSGIALHSLEGTAENRTVVISGTADDRSQLLAWRDALQSLDLVESIDLPLENLLEKNNISFQLTIILVP